MDTSLNNNTATSVTNDLRAFRTKFVESLRLSKSSISTSKLKVQEASKEILLLQSTVKNYEDIQKEQTVYIHELERKLSQQTRDAESRMETLRDDYQRLTIDHDSTKLTLTEKLNEIRKLKQEINDLRTHLEVCNSTHSLTVPQDQTIVIMDTTDSVPSSNSKATFSLDTNPTLPTFTAFPEVQVFLNQIMQRLKDGDTVRTLVTNDLRTVQTDHQRLTDQFHDLQTKTKDYLHRIRELEQCNKLLQETLNERNTVVTNLEGMIQRNDTKTTELDHQILTLQQSVSNKTQLVHSLQTQLQDAEATIKKRNELLSTAHDSLNLQEVALNHVRTEHLALRKENDQLSKRLQSIDEYYQKEKEQYQTETNRLNDKLVTTIAEMDKYKENYTTLNNKLHDTEHQLMEAIQHRTKLQVKLLDYETNATTNRNSHGSNAVPRTDTNANEEIPELLVLDTSPTVIDSPAVANNTDLTTETTVALPHDLAMVVPSVSAMNAGTLDENSDQDVSGTKRKREELMKINKFHRVY